MPNDSPSNAEADPGRPSRGEEVLPAENLPWWRSDRPWGFRFSAFDAAVMLGGLALGAFGFVELPELALITAFTLGHFLLFCNTFRVGGERELAWMAALAANLAIWRALAPAPPLGMVLLTQLPITLIVIVSAVFSRLYHGAFCERINPQGYRAGAILGGSLAARILSRLGVPPRWIKFFAGRLPPDAGR